jgi:N-acyl-D-aspartate/D-glutamate deacylase
MTGTVLAHGMVFAGTGSEPAQTDIAFADGMGRGCTSGSEGVVCQHWPWLNSTWWSAAEN